MKIINGFGSCKNLSKIDIPKTVQFIGESAFSDCKSLTNVNLNDGCWSISEHAFAGCENLQKVEIPSSVEFIREAAFAGCKNLTITFLEDNKRYLQDIIEEQEDIEKQYREEMGEDFSLDEVEYTDEEIQISNEEKKELYDDLGVKYRTMDLFGHEILWYTGKLIIKPDALAGVKEVIVYNEEKMQIVINSGYEGKITLINKEKDEKVTFDFNVLKEYQKQQKAEVRDKYYKNILIPSGGTTNWLLNCEKNHYRGNFYNGKVVCEIPISFDSRITVEDYTQPKTDTYKYTKEDEEFFTSVTFYKKELDNHSIYSPQEYERAYSIYYPYGARFNKDLLLEIGSALSGLIDQARDLPVKLDDHDAIFLQSIQTKQKQLIDVLINGTNNKNVVSEILDGWKLPEMSNQVKEAQYKKDWLPHFTTPLFSEHKEVEEYRKKQKEKNNSLEK